MSDLNKSVTPKLYEIEGKAPSILGTSPLEARKGL